MDEISREKMLLVMLVLVAFFLFSMVPLKKAITGDEAAHSNAALFAYRLAAEALSAGFSTSSTVEYAADYHAHYKVFTTISVYPPLYYLVSIPFIAAFGNFAILSKMVVILESLVVLFFLFKIARLYDRDRLFPFACVALLALHPVFTDISTTNYLDIGLTALLTGGIYFFIKYMRMRSPHDLYYSAAFFGLSLAAKPMLPVAALALLVVMFLEKKLHLFRKDFPRFMKALGILVIFAVPLIAQQTVVYYYFGPESFIEKWTVGGGQENKLLPSLEPGEPAFAWNSHIMRLSMDRNFNDFQEFTKNTTAFLFQLYLVPFFAYGLLRVLRGKEREAGKIALLMVIITLYLFTVRIHVNSLKHIVIALPFVTLISAKGLFDFFRLKSIKKYRRFLILVVMAFALASLLQTLSYVESMRSSYTSSDFGQTAGFMIDEAEGPTSVLLTQDMAHAFAFAMLDSERKIYSLFIPRNTEELELAVEGDFSYHDTSSWDKFGIEHPMPSYAIVSEWWVKQTIVEYGLDYFTGRPERFELVKVFEGRNPMDRTYIFRIIPAASGALSATLVKTEDIHITQDV